MRESLTRSNMRGVVPHNPFKFVIQPATGTIFIDDVGQGTWEEINQLEKEANYGWNTYGGPESDPRYTNPILAYGHDGDIETTGCSITGGVFYNPKTLQFPSGYVGDYFFADFCSGCIRSRSFAPSTGETSISDFAKEIVRPVDFELSTGGDLYYLSSTSSTPRSVGKIWYSEGTA
jgi:glucose/arabinose dehydrogenase